MKLGKDTGSTVNWMMGNCKGTQPEIGMGVTLLSWTDRNPGTIIEIFSRNKRVYIKVQADSYKRVDKNGFSETQEYVYSPNPNGAISHYRLNNEGQWEGCWFNSETNRWVKRDGEKIYVGEREKFHDFSF